MDPANYFVSIIIPTYNRAHIVARAIESVLQQSYKHFELIVIDDGSTDDTAIQLKSFIENKSIQFHQKDNAGVASARNFGVSKSRGQWLAFLDSDDEWLPHKLQDQIDFLMAHRHLRIVYGEETWIRNGVKVNQKKHHKKSGGHIFEKCLEQCLIAPSSVLLERKLFDELNGFDESFIVCEDYDLWIKISSQYEIGFIEHPLILKYGGHEDQLSTKFFAMDMWRLKAMNNLLRKPFLSDEYQTAIKSAMLMKGRILINGYQKHGNFEEAENVRRLLAF